MFFSRFWWFLKNSSRMWHCPFQFQVFCWLFSRLVTKIEFSRLFFHNFKGFRKENGKGFANLEMDYGKEIQFSTMSKWIMERIRGFNSGVLGFKGFIMEKGKRNGKRKKLWKGMPTLGSKAESAKRSFASKELKVLFLMRSFASRLLLRFAQPF